MIDLPGPLGIHAPILSWGNAVDKVIKWVLALIVSGAAGLLSAASFSGWQMGANSNKILNMLVGVQAFLVNTIGSVPTGILFAVFAIFILWAAWQKEPAENA